MVFRLSLLILALVFLALGNVAAVTGDTVWTRYYGGWDTDIPYAVEQVSDGGYFIAGYTRSLGIAADFFLVRTDQNGDTLWERNYGGYDDDLALSAQVTSDGGVIMAGWTKSQGAGGTDFYLVKADSAGNLLWDHTYGGVSDDTAKFVRQTSDGGYIICGSTTSFGEGSTSDIYVVKTNSSGDTIWTHRSGGIIDDGASCIKQTADGGYILSGWTGRSDGGHDIYIEKLNSSGHAAWYQGYDPGADNQGLSIIQTNDGGYVTVGYTYLNPRALDVYLMKINSGGTVMWDRNYGTNLWELGYYVSQTPDHGLIIAGAKWVTLFPDTLRTYIIRTDSVGNRIWERDYGFGYLDEGMCIAGTSDGNYVCGAYSNGLSQWAPDFCLMKVEGENAMSADDAPMTPTAFILEPNYPNPFNAQTTICYCLPYSCHTVIEIYDILGHLISDFKYESQEAGYHQVTWNSSGCASGIYFYKLKANDYQQTKRMVLLK